MPDATNADLAGLVARAVDQLAALAGLVDDLDRKVAQLADDVDRLEQLERGRP